MDPWKRELQDLISLNQPYSYCPLRPQSFIQRRRSPREAEPEGGGAWHPSGEKIELLVSWGRTPEHLKGSTLNPLQRPPLLTSCQGDPSCLLSQAWLEFVSPGHFRIACQKLLPSRNDKTGLIPCTTRMLHICIYMCIV